jgi:branched-chain amino acid aminotransferase
LDLAKELNIKFEIKKLKVEDVLGASEAFFSGTAAEVVPINSLDNEQIGEGRRGPVTGQLQSTYFDQVRGAREANQNWHTLVE